jgi:SAM-dependent methyltransferase
MKNITDVKNYWDSRPCNVKHSQSRKGTKKYFDEVENKKYFVEPHIPEFAEFEKWKGKRVLEIGCGIGTDSINFVKNGVELTAIELSEESLSLCKKRFNLNKLQSDLFLGDAENLSNIIPITKYDLIYSFGVIHHTPNPENVINQIKKYMDKNTEVRIMLYSKYSWKSFEFFLRYGYKFRFNFKKTIQYYAEAQLDCPIAFVYSKKEVKNLLKDFDILEIKKDHIFPYIIEDYINHEYNKRYIFKILPQPIFRFLEKTLGWHLLIKFKLK